MAEIYSIKNQIQHKEDKTPNLRRRPSFTFILKIENIFLSNKNDVILFISIHREMNELFHWDFGLKQLILMTIKLFVIWVCYCTIIPTSIKNLGTSCYLTKRMMEL